MGSAAGKRNAGEGYLAHLTERLLVVPLVGRVDEVPPLVDLFDRGPERGRPDSNASMAGHRTRATRGHSRLNYDWAAQVVARIRCAESIGLWPRANWAIRHYLLSPEPGAETTTVCDRCGGSERVRVGKSGRGQRFPANLRDDGIDRYRRRIDRWHAGNSRSETPARLACWESERQDRGVYHARNKALNRIGEWICFLGAGGRVATTACSSWLESELTHRQRPGRQSCMPRFGSDSADESRAAVMGEPWPAIRSDSGDWMAIPHQATFHHADLFTSKMRRHVDE